MRYGIADRCAGFLTERIAFLGAMAKVLQTRAAVSPGDAVAARLDDMSSFFLRMRDAMESALRD